MRLTAILSLVVFGIACAVNPAGQKTATYVAVSNNETDRLQIIVTPNSLVLNGYLEISIKQSRFTLFDR